MPLPKINTPTYELVIPSTGKKVKYRPFLVREEKILIMALESEDIKQITAAIVEILNECVLTKNVKIETLATFDIEYLFLNVRAKSVGESVEVNVTCPDDNEEESWSASDSTKKELEEFVEQLNTKQFKLVENFFTTMPKLSHTVKVTNPQTNVESDVVLEGLAAFFS